MGDEPLRVFFHSLFSIASSKETLVADAWTQIGERGLWTPRFSRHLNNWEIVDVKRFYVRLQMKVVNGEGEDVVIWMETRNGIFSVKSLGLEIFLSLFQ